MLARFREQRNEQAGFTVIELLVVMLILGILAVIAVPALFSQRDRARDADSKAAVRTAQTAIEAYQTDNGTYVGADVATLIEIEPTLEDGNITAVTPDGTNGYALTSTSDTDTTFTITRDGGTTELSCLPLGEGECPTSGDWSGDTS